jgi:hypothetical protein
MIQHLGHNDKLDGADVKTLSISYFGPPTSSTSVDKRDVFPAINGGRLLVKEPSFHLRCRSAA